MCFAGSGTPEWTKPVFGDLPSLRMGESERPDIEYANRPPPMRIESASPMTSLLQVRKK
jgi:hypothetical protein